MFVSVNHSMRPRMLQLQKGLIAILQAFADTKTAAYNQTLTNALMQSTHIQSAKLLPGTYVREHVSDQYTTCAWRHVND